MAAETFQQKTAVPPTAMAALRAAFGGRVKEHTSLARFTAARVGGLADGLLEVNSLDELAQACTLLWKAGSPILILGGGSNVLVSDAGVRGVVLINRTRQVRFESESKPQVWAESGANFGMLARQAASRGLAGLEWAAGIPGTVGGAVIGNAGAHSGDMAGNLLLAEILHPNGVRENWMVDRFEYAYRSSVLKEYPGSAVVLAALLRLESSTPESVQAKMDVYNDQRRRTQPPGASIGSMFKNPPGDFAGRLLDAAGMKGMVVGDAEISPLHANFFINRGRATASDIWTLIERAREVVAQQFGVQLELEIERVGDWR